VEISTTSITLLKKPTEMVKPPRALFVPYPFGYPLGKPNDPQLQHQIISAALQLLTSEDTPPLLVDFQN
jgi:hypothetical protein